MLPPCVSSGQKANSERTSKNGGADECAGGVDRLPINDRSLGSQLVAFLGKRGGFRLSYLRRWVAVPPIQEEQL